MKPGDMMKPEAGVEAIEAEITRLWYRILELDQPGPGEMIHIDIKRPLNKHGLLEQELLSDLYSLH